MICKSKKIIKIYIWLTLWLYIILYKKNDNIRMKMDLGGIYVAGKEIYSLFTKRVWRKRDESLVQSINHMKNVDGLGGTGNLGRWCIPPARWISTSFFLLASRLYFLRLHCLHLRHQSFWANPVTPKTWNTSKSHNYTILCHALKCCALFFLFWPIKKIKIKNHITIFYGSQTSLFIFKFVR